MDEAISTDLASLIEQLANTEELPEAGLLAAIFAHGPEAVEPLAELATRRLDEKPDDFGCVPWCAAGLLIDLADLRGLPAILRVFREDAEAPDDFLERFDRFGLAAMPGLLEILRDPTLDMHIRWGASTALVGLTRHDPDSRARLASEERELLASLLDRPEEMFGPEDDSLVAVFVGDLAEMQDPEARPLIERAFELDRVDRSIVGPDTVERFYLEAPAVRPGRASSWLEEYRLGHDERRLPSWYGRDPDFEDADEEDELSRRIPPATIVNTTQRIGRNDPCWCGSGKKYKKCHWKADQEG